MSKHHTKEKGDLGVFKVKLDMFEKGLMIMTPETEHSPFDVVGYKEGVFYRVQVKYISLDSNGCIRAYFRTSWSDTNGKHTKYYDKNEIDVYAIYNPETDRCYYLDMKEFGNSVSLRVKPSGNNQTCNVKFAINYLDFPFK